MALPDLTTQTVNSTYQRLLQVGEGGNMFDGTGSLFIPLSASHEITHEVSSSHASTASMADRHNPDNPVFGKGYALIKHGTTLSGGTAALYLGTTNTGMDLVRLSDSSLVLGGVTQNYGWRIFGIKHGYHDHGSGFEYTTEIDNLIATGSMKVSGSIEINLPSGSAFTVIETDSDQQGRLDFAYTNGDPTLEIGSRSNQGYLHLRKGFTGTGFKLGSDGSIQINGSNAFRMQPTYFQPDTTNASTLGAFNRRWKDTFLYSGAKLGWSANTSADLVALQHVAATNTLQVTGSSDVILDVKGVVSASKFTANSGSSATLPGYSFHHASGTGLYSQAAGYLQLQVNGGSSPEFELTTGQSVFRVPIQLNNNELINPSRIRGIGSITGSTSGNNLGVSASLDIKGNTVITGSLDVSGSITAEEDIELHYPKSLKWRGANGLSYNSIDSDDVSGYYAIRYTSNGGDGDVNEMHEFYTNKGNVNNTRVSYITRGGDFHVTGSITSENTGSFKHIELGKSGTLNGTIKFNTLHGPNFGFEANNNSLVVTGTTGAPEQGFALDSQVENLSLYDGGSILVQRGLTTGSQKGGGLHVQAQGFNQSNGRKGIYSADSIGPYIGNSSYGGTGTHGTFRIINGLSSDNDADSGSLTLAEFGDNIKFNSDTTITGSLNTTGSLAAFDNDVLIGRITSNPAQPDRNLTIHSYNDSAIIFQNHGTWSKTKLYSGFGGTLTLDEQGGTATPGGRLILGGSGDTGTNKSNYLWIRGDNADDAVHIYLGANSSTYASEIGIERQEGTGVNYESDISLRAAAGLSQHKSEYIFSRKGMFQAQDAGFTISGSGQVFVNVATSSINPIETLNTFEETFVVSGSGRFTDALSVGGTSRTLFTSASMVYSGDNVTQVTQSYEAGTQQITDITYTGNDPQTIAVTGSDGINKLYTIVYDGDNVSEIRVT